jgi:tetratricopeptide (TPR) repeat protein
MTAKECRVFLDQWPEIAFRDPKAGHEHATEGLARIRQLGNAPELLARGHTFMGSSHRRIGQLPEAFEILRNQAIPIYRDRIVALEDESDARRRLGLVHRDFAALGEPGHREKAFDEIDHGFKIYTALNDQEGMARCQLARGTVFLRLEEVTAALQALIPILPKLTGIYAHAAALNVHTALVWSRRLRIPIPKDLRQLALKNVRLIRLTPASRDRWPESPSRRDSYGRRKKTPADALWRWNLAIFLQEERRYQDALQVYVTARDDFAELDMPFDVAEITLDIAPLCARFGMWDKLERVAAEAVRLLGAFPGSAQAVAAYGLWAQAVAAEDVEDLPELSATCHTTLERLRSAA